MHEHVCKQLIQLEIGSQEKMQSENIVQVNASHAEHKICQKGQNIYYQQVFGDSRNTSHDDCVIFSENAAKLLKLSIIPHKISVIPVFFRIFLHFFLFFVCFMK